jgi:hypothetical protein
VFDWIDKLRGSSYYVEFDLDNLEHVFSLPEMAKQLRLEGAKKLFADLRYLVTETLDICRVKYLTHQMVPSEEYSTFVKNLVTHNERRRNLLGGQFHSRRSRTHSRKRPSLEL